MELVMELVGVTFATAALIAMFLYYTIFPTALNILLAATGALFLCRGRHWTTGLLCAFALSLLLTFGTRLPDFLEDALLPAEERTVTRTVMLRRGDTVNLAERITPVRHRSSYFGTPGYEDTEFSARIGPANDYTEDLTLALRNRGLRLNHGTEVADAVTVDFEHEETSTHQRIAIRILQDGTETAHYAVSSRTHHREDLGAGTFRMHVQHIFENTLWNWIMRIREQKVTHPLTRFLSQAISVDDSLIMLDREEATADVSSLELQSFGAAPFMASTRVHFDCARTDAPTVGHQRLESMVTHTDYELEVRWSTDGMETRIEDRDTDLDVRRITCGADGYLVLVSGNSDQLRFVLADRTWRPRAAIDTRVPGFEHTDGRRPYLMSMYQEGARIHLEAFVRGPRNSERENIVELVSAELTHPLLEADYGGGAARLPSVNAASFVAHPR